MDSGQTLRGFSAVDRRLPAGARALADDAWTDLDVGQERRENWMLSYIDLLTLLLTLLVMLLALQPKSDPPMPGELPELAEPRSPVAIEQQPVVVLQDAEEGIEAPVARDTETIERPARPLAAEFEHVETVGVAKAVEVVEVTETIEGVEAVETRISDDTPDTAAPLPSESRTQPMAEPATEEVIAETATPMLESPLPATDSPTIEPRTNRAQDLYEQAFGEAMKALSEHALDGQLKVSQVAEAIHLEVNDKILFSPGSAELKPDGENLLNELAQILLQHRGVISVEGHTDDRPISSEQFPSNWELSSGRATTVTRHLIDHGLEPGNLRAVGYADTRPLQSNATREGRMRNRRVSIILAPAPAR